MNIDKTNYATIRIWMDSNRMEIDLPDTDGMEEQKFYRSHEKYLTRISHGYYTIAKQHRAWVLETLRCLYDGVWERREYPVSGTSEKCDTRCEDAEGDDCECSCAGKYHRGGGEWDYTIGTVLIKQGTRQMVTRWYYSFDPKKVCSIYPNLYAKKLYEMDMTNV